MMLQGLIHKVITLAIALLFPFTYLLIAPALRHDPRWTKFATYTVVTGILAVILDILGGVIIFTRWLEPGFGLYERILIANPLIWLEVMAIRLLLLSTGEKKKRLCKEKDNLI
jgi:hypothetical protein